MESNSVEIKLTRQRRLDYGRGALRFEQQLPSVQVEPLLESQLARLGATVDCVADNRKSKMSEMAADLMHDARFDFDFKIEESLSVWERSQFLGS